MGRGADPDFNNTREVGAPIPSPPTKIYRPNYDGPVAQLVRASP